MKQYKAKMKELKDPAIGFVTSIAYATALGVAFGLGVNAADGIIAKTKKVIHK